MTNYLFAYRGGNGVADDEAKRDAQYARWGQWFEQLGPAVIDGGAATGEGRTVDPSSTIYAGGPQRLSGYSIIAADTLDAAVELARGCPVLEVGGAVDVYEAVSM